MFDRIVSAGWRTTTSPNIDLAALGALAALLRDTDTSSLSQETGAALTSHAANRGDEHAVSFLEGIMGENIDEAFAHDNPMPPLPVPLALSHAGQLMVEWRNCQSHDDAASLRRTIEICTALLRRGHEEPAYGSLARDIIHESLAFSAARTANLGLEPRLDAGAIRAFSHRHYGEALRISQARDDAFRSASILVNQANLYQDEYRDGDVASAARAHRRYDEARGIYLGLGNIAETARAAQNQGHLYQLEYEAGDQTAAARAHERAGADFTQSKTRKGW